MAQKSNGRPGIPDLVGGISTDAERLIQLNVELAKQEGKELAVRNGVAAGLLTAGGLFFLLGLLVALPVLLVEWIDDHLLAALVWTVLYLVLGAALLLIGKARLRIEPPRRTIESLKETKEWAVRQLKSSAR